MWELYKSLGYMSVEMRRSMESCGRVSCLTSGGMNLCASVVDMAMRMLISGVHVLATSMCVPRYL